VIASSERDAAGGASADAVTVERAERLDELHDDWVRLADSADHPFATWEWNAGWWRRFGSGRELDVLACRQPDEGIVAIVPLYVEGPRALRVARFIGDGDLRGPVCAARRRAAAAAGMREAIAGAGSCRLLLAERLPGGQDWPTLLGGRPVATHPDPVLPLAGLSWEEFLESRSRNFRQQVRRRERKLVEEHGLAFRLSDDPDRLNTDLDALFRLHAMRWGAGSSGVFDGRRGEFQREFAAAAQRRGWLRLWIAEIGGEAAAAWYGWRFAGSEWYYQAGRDPRFDDLSLGFVLLAHTVREACADGVDAYRFLAGAEPFKWRFATEDLKAESVALGRGAVGRLGALGIAAAARMPAALRRRLDGRARAERK
jgi:CelD/BcsL family acetyltransferase involved in cellulose biosynthesis